MKKMEIGRQIVYVPSHVKEWHDYNYPYGAQPGFVSGLSNVPGHVFCRYWLIEDGKPINELRTKANGELTPVRLLLAKNTVPQEWVKEAREWIEKELEAAMDKTLDLLEALIKDGL